MQPINEFPGPHYLLPLSLSEYSSSFISMSTQNNQIPSSTFDSFLSPLINFQQIHPQVPEFNLQSSPHSNNSTSDEANEQPQVIINDRKQRRMKSNRESARRSRLRKQKHHDELLSQNVWLRDQNHQLVDQLNLVSESNENFLQENALLKEENAELRQMLFDMQLKFIAVNLL